VTRHPTRAALLAAAPRSLRERNAPTPAPVPGTPRTAPPDASAVHHRRSTPAATALPEGVVVLSLDGVVTRSEANTQIGGRWDRTRRRDAAHAAVTRATRGLTAPPLPVRVCLTRLGPGTCDVDNLAGAMKATQDAIARWLGVDDGPTETRVEWRRAQERTKRGVYGVRVTLAPLPAPRSTVDAGEAADVVVLRVTRPAFWRWADAALAGEGRALDAGGVLVRVEWTDTEAGR